MSESQWWLYDLVVMAIAGLCLYNGIIRGLLKSICGLVLTVVACIAAYFISTPLAEMSYDAFLQEPCRNTIEERLPQYDLVGTVRSELDSYGISLPITNEQLADLLRMVDDDDTLAWFGLDGSMIREAVGSEIVDYLKSADGLLPSWAMPMLEVVEPEKITEAAVDTAADLITGNREDAAEVLEDTFLRPVVVSFLSALIFVIATVLISAMLRALLLMLPKGGMLSAVDQLLGGVFGILKAGVYIALVVIMTRCIVAMQNGMYPFFSEETIEKTLLFRALYHLIQW